MIKRWHGFGTKTVEVPVFERVCLYLRFKPEEELTEKQKKDMSCEPGKTILKLFRNIPKADLEMLFPNTELRMRLIDKLIIGVPALVGGLPVLVKLTPVLLALSIVLGFRRGEVNLPSIVAGLGGKRGSQTTP